MTGFEIVEGSPGLHVDEVAHVMLPGRGRNAAGDGLSPQAADRTDAGGTFYIEQELAERGGVIVPCGYKSDGDKAGQPWRPEDRPDEEFRGIPEADSMCLQLVGRGISRSAIRVERHSFDSVTNFTYAENEGHFPDRRPIAIVAQEKHLERMLKKIAPKTLRREYLGVVAPEVSAEDPDSFLAGLVSQAILLGVDPETLSVVRKTERRAKAIWHVANLVQGIKPLFKSTPYSAD